MSFHSSASLGARHPVHNYEYADATARNAASGFTATDVGRVARQLDNDSFWVLNDHSPVVWTQLDGGGAGEANTGNNVGTGQGNVFRDKTGTTLNFKKLQQSGAITITDNADEIVIATAGAVGEANTASNVGTAGVGIFKQKTGVALEFKNINAGSTKVSVVDDTGDAEIDIDVVENQINHDSLSGFVAAEHIDWTQDQGATDVHTNNVPDGADDSAIHDNQTGEIQNITEKTTPVSADVLLIEDSAATYAKKRLTLGNLPMPLDLRNLLLFDHFMSSNNDTDEMGIMGWREYGSGTGSGITYTGVAGHPGVLAVQAGTGTSARRAIACGADGDGGKIVVGGTNPVEFESLVRWPTTADLNSANLLQAMFGFGLRWQDDVELDNGVYFRLSPGTSPNLFLVCASSATRSTVDLSIAPVAGTWVRLGFTATATSVQAVVNGTNTGAPITTNIPTTGVGVGFKQRSNNGAGSVLHVDYVQVKQVTDKEG